MSEPEYTLALPFVLTKSNGGPHDDAAFVSGYRMGHLDQELRVAVLIGAIPRPHTVPPSEKVQVDLLAMQHGYVVEFFEYDESWLIATFKHADAEAPDHE